jgi:hypothetical protein
MQQHAAHVVIVRVAALAPGQAPYHLLHMSCSPKKLLRVNFTLRVQPGLILSCRDWYGVR